MGKELGEKLSYGFIIKVANSVYITNHCFGRLKERTDLYVDNDLPKTLGNVNKAIRNCRYGYNNDDGTITIVLENDISFICSYDDNFKKWNLITVKEKSESNTSAWEKRKMAQRRTKDRYRWDRLVASEKAHRFKEKHKKSVKYKRDNSWKGEEW